MSVSIGTSLKVGVYVDADNMYRNGASLLRYNVLRDFACRDSAAAMRMNVYVSFDKRRAGTDPIYAKKARGFQSQLRDFGYKVIEKEVSWYKNEDGTESGKSNTDLDLGVDAILQSERLDRVLLVTGDGDFVQVVRAIQNKGCRVEVVGAQHVSHALIREADQYWSAYLIPGLVSFAEGNPKGKGLDWGQPESRVRGTCRHFNSDKQFGFMRYMTRIDGDIGQTTDDSDDSPYCSAWFHASNLPSQTRTDDLPSWKSIFEFDLMDEGKECLVAKNIEAVPM